MTDRLTDAQLTIIKKTGDRTVQSMARELIELRTRPAEPQGLTEEEREALEWLRTRPWLLTLARTTHLGPPVTRALAVLDRLLKEPSNG